MGLKIILIWQQHDILEPLLFMPKVLFGGLPKRHGIGLKVKRPAICTEWLNRGTGSTVADCLPLFLRENMGAMHWGLVNGKTQTHLNWVIFLASPIQKFSSMIFNSAF